VEVREQADVSEIVVESDQVVGVKTADGATLEAEQVVIAAGVWSGGIRGLPDAACVPVHPVKGQILRLHDPTGPGLISRVLRTPGGYLVPRGDGRYVLGATMEEKGFDTTVTVGAAFNLLRDVTEVIPGLSELVIDEFIAGLRPATRDGLPVIGPGAVAGLHWAVGHFRNGILLAPVTADIVVADLLGQDRPAIAASFVPSRQTLPAPATSVA
jgi:glycine oxidase